MDNHVTVTQIARQIGCTVYRVNYFLKARKIEPADRIGNTRVYDASVVDRIKADIERADAARGGEE